MPMSTEDIDISRKHGAFPSCNQKSQERKKAAKL